MSKDALKVNLQVPAGSEPLDGVLEIGVITMLLIERSHCAFAVYILAKAQIRIKKSKIFFMLQGFVGLFTDPFFNK